ncbi:MAG: hypothetical protein HN337_01960 [Deltaproteobacteria bacterium]|nr:hypothetical protein [Deltaproteobacteria bacterium]
MRNSLRYLGMLAFIVFITTSCSSGSSSSTDPAITTITATVLQPAASSSSVSANAILGLYKPVEIDATLEEIPPAGTVCYLKTIGDNPELIGVTETDENGVISFEVSDDFLATYDYLTISCENLIGALVGMDESLIGDDGSISVAANVDSTVAAALIEEGADYDEYLLLVEILDDAELGGQDVGGELAIMKDLISGFILNGSSSIEGGFEAAKAMMEKFVNNEATDEEKQNLIQLSGKDYDLSALDQVHDTLAAAMELCGEIAEQIEDSDDTVIEELARGIRDADDTGALNAMHEAVKGCAESEDKEACVKGTLGDVETTDDSEGDDDGGSSSSTPTLDWSEIFNGDCDNSIGGQYDTWTYDYISGVLSQMAFPDNTASCLARHAYDDGRTGCISAPNDFCVATDCGYDPVEYCGGGGGSSANIGSFGADIVNMSASLDDTILIAVEQKNGDELPSLELYPAIYDYSGEGGLSWGQDTTEISLSDDTVCPSCDGIGFISVKAIDSESNLFGVFLMIRHEVDGEIEGVPYITVVQISEGIANALSLVRVGDEGRNYSLLQSKSDFVSEQDEASLHFVLTSTDNDYAIYYNSCTYDFDGESISCGTDELVGNNKYHSDARIASYDDDVHIAYMNQDNVTITDRGTESYWSGSLNLMSVGDVGRYYALAFEADSERADIVAIFEESDGGAHGVMKHGGALASNSYVWDTGNITTIENNIPYDSESMIMGIDVYWYDNLLGITYSHYYEYIGEPGWNMLSAAFAYWDDRSVSTAPGNYMSSGLMYDSAWNLKWPVIFCDRDGDGVNADEAWFVMAFDDDGEDVMRVVGQGSGLPMAEMHDNWSFSESPAWMPGGGN